MKKFQYYKKETQTRALSFVFCFVFLFLVLYSYVTEYTWLLTRWLIDNEKNEFTLDFQCTEISEAFQTYIHVSFLGAFLYCLPLIFYHLFCFFAPGFYFLERQRWIKHILFLFALFYFALFFGFKLILGLVWHFFSHLEINTHVLNVQFEPRVLNTMNFVSLILGITICLFQFPYLFYICLKTNTIQSKFFSENRSYIYIVLILISSFLAPPDIYVQCIILFTSFLFLESFIFLSFLLTTFKRKKEPFSEKTQYIQQKKGL